MKVVRFPSDGGKSAKQIWAFTLIIRFEIKDTLWVLRGDQLLVHVSVDISLITKHILDHVISLES